MDLSEDWKSLFPISSVFPAPLLRLNRDPLFPPTATAATQSPKEIGPLVFYPSLQSLTLLYTSPSFSLHLPSPFPLLSLSRFFQISSPSILPSKASSIAAQFGPQITNADKFLNYNCLQLLRCPVTDSIFAFFPSGENCDSVGFVVLSVENSNLVVKFDKLGNCDSVSNNVHTARNRIRQLAVNPVGDFTCFSSDDDYTCVGYLLTTTLYSVCWYAVKIREVGSDAVRARLDLLGVKEFKTCAVDYACWSSHLAEESLVLLENGELFLFDVNSCCETWTSTSKYTGKRVRVSWDKYKLSEKGVWLSCEFSWHPRILIATHSSAVFMIDLRSEGCIVSCLLRIETLLDGECIINDQLVAFSKADSDGFLFIVASNHLLFLCDVRKPMLPLLRWSHTVSKPDYITVFRLSELRSNSREDEYGWASNAGYGILMGSFWNCEFGLFCFGPDTRGCSASPVSKFCNSFYAWGLPSGLQLGAGDCHCGSCLVNKEFWKGALPEWIDWRHKKEVILGFGILDKDLLAQLSPSNGLGEFMLIRLTSCGKLESQRYSALWEYAKTSEKASSVQPCFEDSLIYDIGESEYNFPKRYQYLELKWLNAFLESSLGQHLVTELKGNPQEDQDKFSFGSDFHENMCQKLNVCGLSRLKGTMDVDDMFKEISLPTSIHEIALSCVWSHLPVNLLRLSFCSHSELLKDPLKQEEMSSTNKRKRKEVPFEFFEVPEKPQFPPFLFRKPSSQTNKWSNNWLAANALLGPVVPLPFLATVSKLDVVGAENTSADLELKLQCDKVMQVASEVCTSDTSSQVSIDHDVSLADDKEHVFFGPRTAKKFASFRPVASSKKNAMETSVYKDDRHATVVYKARQNLFSSPRTQINDSQLFDLQCPVELKFDAPTPKFGSNELKAYKLLKRQYTNFKEGLHHAGR